MKNWKYRVRSKTGTVFESVLTYRSEELHKVLEDQLEDDEYVITFFRVDDNGKNIPPRGETTSADKFDVAGQIAERRVQSQLQ